MSFHRSAPVLLRVLLFSSTVLLDLAGCAAGDHQLPTRLASPPAPLPEIRPAAPTPGMVWIHGAWHYDGVQYIWIPGRWDSPTFLPGRS